MVSASLTNISAYARTNTAKDTGDINNGSQAKRPTDPRVPMVEALARLEASHQQEGAQGRKTMGQKRLPLDDYNFRCNFTDVHDGNVCAGATGSRLRPGLRRRVWFIQHLWFSFGSMALRCRRGYLVSHRNQAFHIFRIRGTLTNGNPGMDFVMATRLNQR